MSGRTHNFEIRVLGLAEILPIRHAVLRAGRPVETARYANDDEPETMHFGAFRDGKLLSVASVYRAGMPERPGVPAIQLRGMATLPEARGGGLGSALVERIIRFAREKQARVLWCNARVTAAEFYRKLGFEIVSDEFDIPNIGPHYLMMLNLAA